MSRTFRFMVVGEPKGQPRARAFARKVGNAFTARVYNPATAEGWKNAIAISARDAGLDGVMMQGPIILNVHCYFARPKSHYGTGKNATLLKSAYQYETRKISKPDLDNVMKAVKDCLSQIGAWKDDSQVCYESISKEWSLKEKSYSEFYIVGIDNANAQ
jgi:crossover junction endodeoxyribonuclease RusA